MKNKTRELKDLSREELVEIIYQLRVNMEQLLEENAALQEGGNRTAASVNRGSATEAVGEGLASPADKLPAASAPRRVTVRRRREAADE